MSTYSKVSKQSVMGNLISCQKCFGHVKPDLIVCKFCGADMRNNPASALSKAAPKAKSARKPMSLVTRILLGVILLYVIGSFFASSKNASAKAAPQMVAKHLSKAEIKALEREVDKALAKERAAEQAKTIALMKSKPSFKKALQLASDIKRDSGAGQIRWETIVANKAGNVFCFAYRASGMREQYVAVVNDKPSADADVWNKNCLGKQFDDMRFVGRMI